MSRCAMPPLVQQTATIGGRKYKFETDVLAPGDDGAPPSAPALVGKFIGTIDEDRFSSSLETIQTTASL